MHEIFIFFFQISSWEKGKVKQRAGLRGIAQEGKGMASLEYNTAASWHMCQNRSDRDNICSGGIVWKASSCHDVQFMAMLLIQDGYFRNVTAPLFGRWRNWISHG
jgi:hypothetical protein